MQSKQSNAFTETIPEPRTGVVIYKFTRTLSTWFRSQLMAEGAPEFLVTANAVHSRISNHIECELSTISSTAGADQQTTDCKHTHIPGAVGEGTKIQFHSASKDGSRAKGQKNSIPSLLTHQQTKKGKHRNTATLGSGTIDFCTFPLWTHRGIQIFPPFSSHNAGHKSKHRRHQTNRKSIDTVRLDRSNRGIRILLLH